MMGDQTSHRNKKKKPLTTTAVNVGNLGTGAESQGPQEKAHKNTNTESSLA